MEFEGPKTWLTVTETRQPCYAFVTRGKVHARWSRAVFAVPQRLAAATARLAA
jgi:hypothetical protein